jgi:hypothetical protein
MSVGFEIRRIYLKYPKKIFKIPKRWDFYVLRYSGDWKSEEGRWDLKSIKSNPRRRVGFEIM